MILPSARRLPRRYAPRNDGSVKKRPRNDGNCANSLVGKNAKPFSPEVVKFAQDGKKALVSVYCIIEFQIFSMVDFAFSKAIFFVDKTICRFL